MSLILNGTDGLSDVDGSAATPAIRGTDANTGIFFPAADTIAFAEGGAEVMRIDSSGRVGIGTSSPAFTLDVRAATSVISAVSTTGTNSAYMFVNNTGGDFYLGRDNSAGTTFGGGAYSANIYSAGAYPMIFWTNATERMRLTSGGRLLINSPSFTEGMISIKNNTSSSGLSVGVLTNGDNGVNWYNASNTYVSSIVVNSGTVAYNTSSD